MKISSFHPRPLLSTTVCHTMLVSSFMVTQGKDVPSTKYRKKAFFLRLQKRKQTNRRHNFSGEESRFLWFQEKLLWQPNDILKTRLYEPLTDFFFLIMGKKVWMNFKSRSWLMTNPKKVTVKTLKIN